MNTVRPGHPVVVETTYRMNHFSQEAAQRRLAKEAGVTRRGLPIRLGMSKLVSLINLFAHLPRPQSPTQVSTNRLHLRRRPAHR